MKSTTHRPKTLSQHGSIVWTGVSALLALGLILMLGGYGIALLGAAMKTDLPEAEVAAAAAPAAAQAPAAPPEPAAPEAAPVADTPAPPAEAAPAAAPAPETTSAAGAAVAAGQAGAAMPGPGTVKDVDGVQTIEITTHPMQFLYMVNAFTVKSGQKVKIEFKNTSTQVPQPHNIVIAKPGKKAVIEAAAQAMMTDPSAMAKGYIPESPEIFAHSKLIQPGQADTMEFEAPAPGTYDYLCTFPGHWILMKGVMTVE